jgi:hypothetical protein
MRAAMQGGTLRRFRSGPAGELVSGSPRPYWLTISEVVTAAAGPARRHQTATAAIPA